MIKAAALGIAAGLLIGTIFSLTLIGIAALADSPKRFERIKYEDTGPDNFVHYFEVWHDRETGQEFACALTKEGIDAPRSMACFPTGRTWK